MLEKLPSLVPATPDWSVLRLPPAWEGPACLFRMSWPGEVCSSLTSPLYREQNLSLGPVLGQALASPQGHWRWALPPALASAYHPNPLQDAQPRPEPQGELWKILPVWPGRLSGQPQLPGKPLPGIRALGGPLLPTSGPSVTSGMEWRHLGQHGCPDRLLTTCPLFELQRLPRSASTPGPSTSPRVWR